MDEFREWLSDNLRYFMLGGAILLVVIVLFVGVRACVGGKKSDSGSSQTQEETGSEDGTVSTVNNPLVDAKEEIKTLIESYYTALGNKDVEALRSIEVDFAPSDEAQVTNSKNYIEGYEVGDVYTKDGMVDGSYVVYACFNYLCKDITTPVPAMSVLYVVTDTDGTFKIQGGDTDTTEVTNYINGLSQDADVVELTAKVRSANQAAEQSDPALAAFLSQLGEDGSKKTEDSADGTKMVVTEGTGVANVRAEASSDGEVIGGLEEGTEITKLGQDGDWIQIEYQGQTGYVHSSLLTPSTSSESAAAEEQSASTESTETVTEETTQQ